MFGMADTIRDQIEASLSAKRKLTEAEENRVAAAQGLPSGVVTSAGSSPSRKTVLCIMALLEEVEELKRRLDERESDEWTAKHVGPTLKRSP